MGIFRGFAIIFSITAQYFLLGKNRLFMLRSPWWSYNQEKVPLAFNRQQTPQKAPSQQDSAPPSCRNALVDQCAQ